MANVAHSTLTGSNLHENKGVASASDNTVATASSNATVWQKLTASHLTGTGNSFGGQYAHFREQQTSGTESSTSLSSGSWGAVVLNTEVTDDLTLSLSSNTISLAAGTYFAEAWLPVYGRADAKAKLRLYNVTDGAELVVGPGGFTSTSGASANVQTGLVIPLKGRFTLSGTKTVGLQQRVTGSAVIDVAPSCNFSSVEVYGELFIWKIA